MAITPYLAMTAAEYTLCDSLPPKVAWMACHFSPYSTGLSNLPSHLTEGSILIVNDSTPIYRHDPGLVAAQLQQITDQFQCCGVLLDFQHTSADACTSLVKYLCEALPCPTGVSEPLAADLPCPVFLSPCPLYTPLEEHIAPWQGREIWLDTAWENGEILVREDGTLFSSSPRSEEPDTGFSDSNLHCHYSIHLTSREAAFLLRRTTSDFDSYLQKAEDLGITRAIGLYQEFKKIL